MQLVNKLNSEFIMPSNSKKFGEHIAFLCLQHSICKTKTVIYLTSKRDAYLNLASAGKHLQNEICLFCHILCRHFRPGSSWVETNKVLKDIMQQSSKWCTVCQSVRDFVHVCLVFMLYQSFTVCLSSFLVACQFISQSTKQLKDLRNQKQYCGRGHPGALREGEVLRQFQDFREKFWSKFWISLYILYIFTSLQLKIGRS